MKEAKNKIKRDKFLLFIFLISFLIRLAFVFVIPPWQSADEYAHYWYMDRIAKTNSLPTPNEEFFSYESFQPPLYYIIGSVFIKIFEPNITHQFEIVRYPFILIILRLISVFAGLLITYFSYRIYLNFTNINSKDRLIATAFISMIPTFVGTTSTLNNDTFVILFSTISIFYSSKREFDENEILKASIFAAIAILMKLNGAVLLPVILFRITWDNWNDKKRLFYKSVIAISVVSVGIITLVIRNYVQFDALVVTDPGYVKQFSFSVDYLIYAVRNLTWSFWFAFGRTYQITPPIYIYLITIVPLLILSIIGIIKNFNKFNFVFIFAFFALGIVTLFSLYYTLTYPMGTATSWGKNLYPVISLTGILLAVGWNYLFKKHQIKIISLAIAMMLTGLIWVLFQY